MQSECHEITRAKGERLACKFIFPFSSFSFFPVPFLTFLDATTLVQWVGHDTWEPVDQLQGERVKAMVNAYNVKVREAGK